MKIAVLISGGVDSAVAVHQLLEQGHDLHLFYIRIGLDTDEGDCSAEEDIEMCSFIARRYNLPFDVVSLHEEYWENVMEYALRTVREGLTPNPDIMCNKMIKFGFFEERWGHEFDKTATGHYATTHEIDGLVYLGTAADKVKDQTDFLCQISYPQLSHIIFPIGTLPKAKVREIAVETKMPNAFRRDSQGICFLGYRVTYDPRTHTTVTSIRRKSINKMLKRTKKHVILIKMGKMSVDQALRSLESWRAYAKHGDNEKAMNAYNKARKMIHDETDALFDYHELIEDWRNIDEDGYFRLRVKEDTILRDVDGYAVLLKKKKSKREAWFEDLREKVMDNPEKYMQKNLDVLLRMNPDKYNFWQRKSRKKKRLVRNRIENATSKISRPT